MSDTTMAVRQQAHRASRIAIEPSTIAAGLFFAAVLAFYLWTAASSASMDFTATGSGVYGQLADAFLHGQTNLQIDPPAGLLQLPNPYDPLANRSFQLGAGIHDLSLYHGHLYSAWGPTAALVLFAPLQLVGVHVPEALAVTLFSFLGFVFSVRILWFLAGRFLPATPRWAMAAGAVALACGNASPFLLRSPVVYEVAISCGLCFTFLGVWLLVTAFYGERPATARRLAAASLALGLAIASRPTLAVVGLIPLVLVIAAWRGGHWPGQLGRRRVLLALAVPLGACGLLMVAYNMARFGSPLEFGQRFQLAGFDQSHMKGFNPAYLPPGLYTYLLAPPRPTLLFPFLALVAPPHIPFPTTASWVGPEMSAGVLPMAPIVAGLVLAPFVARSWDPALRRVVLAMAATGVLTMFGLALALWGATERYEVDFLTMLLIPALLVWFGVLGAARRPSRWRRVAASGGLLALGWGCFTGLAVSFDGYANELVLRYPALYHHLEDGLAPVSSLGSRLAGRPVVGRVETSITPLSGKSTWGSLGANDHVGFVVLSAPTTVTLVAPRAGVYHLHATVVALAGAVPGGGTELYVDAPRGAAQLAVGAAGPEDLALPLDAGITRTTWQVNANQSAGTLAVAVRDLTIDGPSS